MKKAILTTLATLLGVAVSAPAQISIAGRIARHVRAVITFGDSHDYQHSHSGRGSGRFEEPRGHWETVCEQVLVPGYWREESVPPTYGWVFDEFGCRRWGVIAEGGCRRIWVPARWETRSRRVWVAC